MKKGFSEILTESFSVLKQSFLSILGLYIGMIVLSVGSGIVSALLLGRQAMFLLPMMKGGNFDVSVLSQFVPQLIIIAILMIILTLSIYLIAFWMILIIRNNALIGQSFFKQSFFETLRKIPKLILLGILLAIFFIVVIGGLVVLFKKMAIIFLLPLLIFCMPLMFMVSYGVICKEGKFFEIISEGISLGMKNWFRIVGYVILFSIGFLILFLVLAFVVSSIAKTSVIAGAICNFLLQFIITLFSYCFYTVFYLDLAEIRPRVIEEIDVSTESETPTLQ